MTRQKYRYICVLIIIGVVCIFPFLARNYLISGYLLYPYPQIDLFNVDWKMSPYMSAIDAAEIKMWGRGIPDVMQVHAPLTTWLQIWLSTSKTMSFLLILDILVLPIVIWKAVKIILAKNIIPADKLSANSDRLSSVDNKLPSLIIALVVAYLNGILWFIGAPLPRYGSIYLFIILVCNINIFLSDRLEISASKETKGENKFYSLTFIREINTLALTVSILMLLSPICYAFSHDFDLLTEKRIWGCNMTATDSLGVDIYYPTVADDLIGYDNFPSTPYTDILDKIELCGSSIADGFRLKTEFKDALIVGNGNIHEKDILKQTQ